MSQKLSRYLAAALFILFVASGCARAISVNDAANGKKAKCGRAYIGRN